MNLFRKKLPEADDAPKLRRSLSAWDLTFMGIGQILTMPLFFASNAIYPIDMMPAWLRHVATVNPLSYEVDALRTLMINGGISSFGLGTDFAVQGLALIVLAAAL